MVDHRKETQEELYQLNASLEDKVIQRTAQLSDSLKIVRDLKEQQDGDYFLTSLLIQPLAANHARNKHVKVETFLKQKKIGMLTLGLGVFKVPIAGKWWMRLLQKNFLKPQRKKDL